MYSAIRLSLPLDACIREYPDRTNLPIDACLVLTTDPKPHLRWTSELLERFVEAVTQLGGSDKATPRTIMRTMGVKGVGSAESEMEALHIFADLGAIS